MIMMSPGVCVSHLLVHMSGVLLYELCEADVIRAQFGEAIQDTCLTWVKKWDVLGHLYSKQMYMHTCKIYVKPHHFTVLPFVLHNVHYAHYKHQDQL